MTLDGCWRPWKHGMIDLSPNYLKTVKGILAEHVPECEVRAFGSRAIWTAKDYSDIDLAIVGVSPLDCGTLSQLKEAFEQSDLPMRVDFLDWHTITDSFRKVIEQDCVVVQKGEDGKLAMEEEEQRMAGEWRETKLGELINIKHGFAFKGHFIHDEKHEDVLLTPGNFAMGGGFKGDKFKYYDGAVSEEFVLREGDLLVTMTDLSKQSDTLGYPALVPACRDGRRYLHNQRLGKISLKETAEIDARYIYYVMCGAEYRHEVLSSATGTTVKHTSPDRIKQFRFLLPPLPEQRAIAHILGTLDDKIELNRRMNETLEAMARALFKDWFVDFGPVRAKMAGRDTGLPKHLADLFPNRLVDSELGEIPEGWEVKELGDLLVLAYGKALKADNRRHDGNVSVYGSNGQVGWHDKRLIQGPGIVVGRKGNPGVVTWVTTDFFPIDTTFYVVPKNGNDILYFLFYALIDQDLPSIAADSAVPGLNRNLAYMNKQVTPDDYIFEHFNRYVGPIFTRSHGLETESRVLASVRDTLLPKLISGEIPVWHSIIQQLVSRI